MLTTKQLLNMERGWLEGNRQPTAHANQDEEPIILHYQLPEAYKFEPVHH